MSDVEQQMIGQTVSRYEIVEKLGVGGMAEVWKAEDVKLGRPVALKFLPPRRVRDARARKRLIQEAQAASALDHPNICTIYEIDETDDAQLFIAMAYYEGETLKDRLFRGPIELEEAVAVVAQIAEGLAKAHRHGIVHRDVKPANVIVTTDGLVKILDFGLAKLAGTDGLTREGTVIGTAAYMSPEQIDGDEIDHRTDIWALGVVFYQMLTAVAPFKRDTELATMHAVLTADPKPLASWVGGLPKAIEEVIKKALAKSREHRYQDMRELLIDLKHLSGDLSAITAQSSSGWLAPSPRGPSIAVLPFADLSPEGDQEYFCDGIAEELILSLAQVEGLRVAARTSAFQYKGAREDIRDIGERLGVGTVLEGSVRKAGSRLRITAQLVDVADGYQLWSERFDREVSDVFALQDEIAGSIVETLRSTLLGNELEAPAERRPTANVEAYNLYLKGRYCWNKRTREGLEKGIDYFLQAIDADDQYAQAYAGLADSYTILGIYGTLPPGDVMPPAKAAAARALEINPNLAEAHTSLGCIKALYDWAWVDAEGDFRKALQLDPTNAAARHWYAINCLTPMGRSHEALTEIRRALELDPLSLVINTTVGLVYYYGRRYDQAIDEYRRTLEIDEDFPIAHLFLGQALLQRSRLGDAIQSIEHALELAGESAEMTASLGHAYALDGRRTEAERLRDELEERAVSEYVSPVLVAQVEIGLERKHRALELLEEAYEMRTVDLAWIEVRPVFDSLRSEPRFISLRDRVGFGELTTTRVGPNLARLRDRSRT